MFRSITITIVLIVTLLVTNVRAQYIPITDPVFAAELVNYTSPACFDGYLLDTTCSYSNVTSMDLSNLGITDITGVKYFDGITYLDVSDNLLTFLPELPLSLNILVAARNNITQVQSIPNGVVNLYLHGNLLDSLPQLPNSLLRLNLNGNEFTYLDGFPPNLIELRFSGNNLDSIGVLPSSLTYLNVGVNNITSILSLPNSIEELIVSENPINSLPASLPTNLKKLWCRDSDFTNLPPLPSGLLDLNCSRNYLTQLPVLPSSLTKLDCAWNQLTSLPPLPSTLNDLQATGNNLSYLPALPPVMSILWVNENPIECLPKLNNITDFDFGNTNITCLPNYGNVTYSSPALSTIPLCTPFNSNGCQVFHNISGKVYFDDNSDCINDPHETRVAAAKIQLYQGGQLMQQVFTGADGLYSFDVLNAPGTYQTYLDTNSTYFELLCPDSGYYTNVLTLTDSVFYDNDMALVCGTNIDMGVSSIRLQPSTLGFRPTSVNNVYVTAGDLSQLFGASCGSGISGEVKLVASGPAAYQSTGTEVPSYVNGDTMVWQVADFGTFDINSALALLVTVDTLTTIGDEVCFEVFVSQQGIDADTTNNHLVRCYQVVNSYDPNNKEVYPLSYIDTTQHWLYYTVNFQNTGNAPALHVQILDTLSGYLDVSTIELLGSSHDNYTYVSQNGEIAFNFANINLPDSTTDEPGSHGYISYKIKLKENLPIGTVIENTAYIYFDFNAPIITNTTVNTIYQPVVQPVITASTFEGCMGDTITLETAFNNAYDYQWYDGNDSLNNATGITLQVTRSGAYKVGVTDGITTAWSDIQQVEIHDLPMVDLNLPVDPLCTADALVNLFNYADPAGGVFTGDNVVGTGFDASNVGSYLLTYTYTDDDGCANSKQAMVVVDECIGIEDINWSQAVDIYPNPVEDQLTISVKGMTNVDIQIYNSIGQLVYTGNVSETTPNVLDVSIWAAGMYHVKLTNGTQVHTTRVARIR